MIKKIEIDGFKNISELEMQLTPLTIITGQNSTGKSSVLQSVLLMQRMAEAYPFYAEYINLDFQSARNKYRNAKSIDIKFTTDKGICSIEWTEDHKTVSAYDNMPEIEKNLFYLSANRTGAENLAANNQGNLISGSKGEVLFSTLEREKSQPVATELARYPESLTLNSQVNYWLSYILGIPMEISVERRPTQDVEIRYKSDDIPGILPTQLGAGVSYLAKILIICLRSQKDDVIMMENPEIHLYPLAQSRLAEFLTYVAASGRQLIIETHSNDLITKIRHEVFKGKIPAEDVTVIYKGSVTEQFKELYLNRNGHFTTDFPETFFDATLREMLEMD